MIGNGVKGANNLDTLFLYHLHASSLMGHYHLYLMADLFYLMAVDL